VPPGTGTKVANGLYGEPSVSPEDGTMEESASPTLAQEPIVSAEPIAPKHEPPPEQAGKNEPSPYAMVVHLTRNWVHAGIFGFAVLCIIIGAVEALFGR
jgi:hypothetical protein